VWIVDPYAPGFLLFFYDLESLVVCTIGYVSAATAAGVLAVSKEGNGFQMIVFL
jgi:hypothetical protein